MTCPFCGANLPDNSDFCDACGTPIASWQSQSSNSTNLNDALFNSAPTSGYSSSYSGTKSSSNSMIKFISTIVILVVLAIVGYNLLGVKYNGTYTLSSMEVDGVEYDLGLMEATLGETYDMSIKISFKRAKLDIDIPGMSEEGWSKIKFNGNDIIIYNPDTGYELKGTYDRNEKTISFEMDEAGVEASFIFEKQ